jgi:hypothetical protein
MDKISRVRNALENNPNVTIVGIKEENHQSNFLNNTFDIFVAPKSGTIDSIKKLQKLLESLAPDDLVPTMMDDFREIEYGTVIEIGTLYFDEVIETTGHTIKRRTWVKLYPNIKMALTASSSGIEQSYKGMYLIEKRDFPTHLWIKSLIKNFFFCRHY